MCKLLRKLLIGTTALPFADSTISQLADAAVSYIDLSRVYEIVDELSLCYLGGNIPKEYRKHILEGLGEDSRINISDNVLRRIAFFIIWKIIKDTDDVSDLTRAISATIFMNYIIVKKSDFHSIPNPEEVKGIYKHHISSLIKSNESLPSDSISNDWVENVFNDDFDVSEITMDHLPNLRRLVEESTLYHIEKYINTIQDEDIKDDFLTTYNIVKKIVDTIKSPLTPCDITCYLERGLKKNVSKRKKLKNVITVLPKYSEDGVFSNSSVLLRLINKKTVPEAKQILEAQFTVCEFGIYLFYEFLVERLIEQNEI